MTSSNKNIVTRPRCGFSWNLAWSAERRAGNRVGAVATAAVLAFALVGLVFLASSCTEVSEDRFGCGRSSFFCPEGFVCNEESGECECTPGSCVEGSACDVETGRCICAEDECCPEDYRFDMDSLTCMCASDECCPDDYGYDHGSQMCVCTLDICCPPGFYIDEDGRCLCEANDACGEGFFCDQDTGDCRCESDESCERGAFCNDFGFCQEKAACTSSFDCPPGQVCDPSQGFCLSGYCTIDADCPWGRICRNNGCHRGCNSSDDCWLAQACIDGFCRGAICDRDEQCGISEYCEERKCIRSEGPYCHMPCDGLWHPCPSGSECVTQMVEGQVEPYCGVDCDPEVGCPNGYSCGGTYITGCYTGVECGTYGLDECVRIEVHNRTPPEMRVCGTGGQPVPAFHTCGPVFGSCDKQPAPGQTTRPGAGGRCHTLCRDGLVCADAGRGEGYRCYASCPTGTCSGSNQCRAAANGVDMICVPPA